MIAALPHRLRPAEDGFPSESGVEAVGIARSDDWPKQGHEHGVGIGVGVGHSPLLMSVLAASCAGSSAARSSTCTAPNLSVSRWNAVDSPRAPAPTISTRAWAGSRAGGGRAEAAVAVVEGSRLRDKVSPGNGRRLVVVLVAMIRRHQPLVVIV